MTKRSERTQEKLQQAFETLLAEKPYEAITMEEIAVRAGRSRVTIYRHYPDKEEMLLDTFRRVIEEVKDKFVYPKDKAEMPAPISTYANLVILFTHIADHRPLYKALVISPVSAPFRTRFRRVFVGVLIHMMDQAGNLARLSAPSDIVCSLMGEMVVGSVVWWLESDSTYEPELVAEIVMRLGETGMFGLTGQTPVESDISYRPFQIDKRPI